ncbi:transposase [endosymbiont GvMRE of Glomus versiforme]|uniref:transposase n=1 Tax=endosymbiont GvMRE of Glomus versiforme TaxID=2039283 RepID=UPI0011C356D9|nr:transposase [endosymbiont GvMRE of Glomus versiforme]
MLNFILFLTKGNIESIYLPSYTPQLNPVELCFNNIRNNIEKSRSWTYEELKSAIDREIANLQKQDLTPYFRHCFEYFDELKQKARSKERLLSKFTHHRSKQIRQPWLSIHPDIYPSWRWMKLGVKPSFKKIKSIQEKVKKCYEKAKNGL